MLRLGLCVPPGQGKQKKGKQPAIDLQAQEKAEAAKEAGNASFKAENFDLAVRQYSEAIHADPSNLVYYNNRAMAQLKVRAQGVSSAKLFSALAGCSAIHRSSRLPPSACSLCAPWALWLCMDACPASHET